MRLIDGISASAWLADKAYNVDSLITQAVEQGMDVVIPPKKNRNVQRAYDDEAFGGKCLSTP